MKQTNSNLDNLFAAAKREEPVISGTNVRELLSNNESMQQPFTLLSTKGIIMSTIGLSIAAFLGYLAFSSSLETGGHPSVTEPLARVQNIPAPRIEEPKKLKGSLQIKQQDDSTNPLISISTPMKIDGVKSLALPEDQFSKFGIEKKDDGTVGFFEKTENGDIYTMSFPKNSWGIIMGDEYDNPHQNINSLPQFSPVIVTDTKGNKRMMQFRNNSNGFKTNAIQLVARSDDNDRDSDDLEMPDIDAIIDRALKISGISVVNDSSKRFEMNVNGTKIQVNVNGDHKSVPEEKKKVIKLNIQRFDSLLKLKSYDRIEKAMGDLKIDSIFASSNISINIGDDNNTIHNTVIGNKNSKHIGNDLIDSIASLAQKGLEKMSKNIDSLIPILVRPATSEHYSDAENITYDDGLIFWYKPEKQVTALLAHDQIATETVQPVQNKLSVISEATIFPNPSSLKATVHFTLVTPRAAAFSIHDLLGNKVLDCGGLGELSAGSYDKELPVSSLSSGVYLLVITTDKGEQRVERLVIEK